MNKVFTILHISDLHKSEESSYKDLFESLRIDSEQYIKDGVEKPSLVVVSGDIVQGAIGKDADKKIKKQYTQASAFLSDICTYFLEGDKSRIIIVPGNHDLSREYCQNAFFASKRDKKTDYKFYKMGASNLRWSWEDFSFYEISNYEIYENRFIYFVEFYNAFYNGIRTITEDCVKHGSIIDIPQYNITFLALNSCYNLDQYNDSGYIYPGAVTENGRELSMLNKKGRLICAVWHHHISGLPTEHNYMDYRVLSSLMQYNVQIGFFGHNHKSHIVQQYTDVTEENEMLLISAGCLYGNYKELPTGVSRQYNLVTIKMENSTANVEIRTRQDCRFDLYSIPFWEEYSIGKSGKNVISKFLQLKVPEDNLDDRINDINELVKKTGEYKHAIEEMAKIRRASPIVNKYIDEYLSKMEATDVEFVLDKIGEPESNQQAMYCLNSAKILRNDELFEQIKNMIFVKNNNNHLVKILRDE